MRSLLVPICVALAASGCDVATAPAFLLPSGPSAPVAAPVPGPGPPPFQPMTNPYFVPGSNPLITTGQRVAESVTMRGASCFIDWDATATCRTYEFVAPADGILEVEVTGTSPVPGDMIDLFLVEAGGPWVVAYEGERHERATLNVKSGRSYGILVLTYPYALPIDFELTAEFRTR